MRWSEHDFDRHKQRCLPHTVSLNKTYTAPKTVSVPCAFEHDEQTVFVEWLRLKGLRHNATPNGGHRAAKTSKLLKAEGVVPGFPDITVWPSLGSGLPILFIEMKRSRGGKTSDEQKDWVDYLNQLGPTTKAVVCLGAGEAIKLVEELYYGL